jgi:hypothetical protein
MFPRPLRRRLPIVVLLSGLVHCSTHGQALEGYPTTLNPKHYTSPSGRYSLFVNPSDLKGRDGGSYRLTSEGREVWSGTRPYTLWDACVTDDGVTGGYAYSNGFAGIWDAGFKAGEGDFRVVIIDAHGKERLDQVTKREPSNFLHMPPDPRAAGVFVHAANDRMVVRVFDADVNRGAEAWWTYQISSGKPLAPFRPKELMPDQEPACSVIDAKPVAGTTLTLLHWWRFSDQEPGRLGARFTLIGLDGKPVWSLELPDDYSIPGDRKAEQRLMDKVLETGAILRTDQAGQFDLWFLRAARRVTFAVVRGPNGVWKVAEVGRRPYVEPVPKETPVLERPLRLLGRIELKASESGRAPDVRDVGGFVFGDRGRIAFLRDAGGKNPALVVTDATGKIVQTVPLDATRTENRTGWSDLTWVGGDRYILIRDDPKDDKMMEGWWIDLATAKATKIPGFSTTVLSKVAGFPDGRFVVKGGLHYFAGGATGDDNLYAFDAKGRRAWTLARGDGTNPNALFDVQSLAVTTDGSIAILDNSRKLVQFFDRAAKHLRTIDLKKAWGREPNYPSGLSADRDGGVLLHDFQGSPPLVRMGPDGAVRSGVKPKYPDGHEFGISAARIAPDGSLWVSDGQALLRLAATGVADRVLGDGPDPRRLDEATAITLDSQDRIYAVARRTGSVHVFEPDGRWLRVCSPGSADVPNGLHKPNLTVSDGGDAYLGLGITGDGPYLHFSPEGNRLRIESLRLKDIQEKWYCQPGMGRRWILGYEKIYLVDSAGKVLRTVTRRPDGQWIAMPENASVAADGSVGVLSSGQGPIAVSLYGPEGEPIRTFTLPSTVAWSFPRLAYDGRFVVVAGEKEVVLFDASGKVLGRFTPAHEDNAWWAPFLTRKSHELLLYNGQNAVYRFALP